MEHNYLHVFRLTVEGLPETVEFRSFHELDDIAEVTETIAKYISRQEDDFLVISETVAVRANRVLRVEHVQVEKTKPEE